MYTNCNFPLQNCEMTGRMFSNFSEHLGNSATLLFFDLYLIYIVKFRSIFSGKASNNGLAIQPTGWLYPDLCAVSAKCCQGSNNPLPVVPKGPAAESTTRDQGEEEDGYATTARIGIHSCKLSIPSLVLTTHHAYHLLNIQPRNLPRRHYQGETQFIIWHVKSNSLLWHTSL